MKVEQSTDTRAILSSTASGVISAALGLVLISNLFSLPRPTIISSQPWKIELFCSIFLLCLAIWSTTGGGKRFSDYAVSDFVRSPVFLFLFAYTAWSGLSMIWATYPLLTVHHTLTWAIYLAFLMIFTTLLQSGTGMRIITGALILVTLIVGLSSLIDYFTIIDFASAEAPLRLRYAKFGEMMITISPLLWVITIYARSGRTRMLTMAAATLAWISVMLSLSKGSLLFGIVGFITMFAGCAFFSARRIRKRVLIMAAVWVVFTVSFQLLFTALTTAPTTTDYFTGRAGNASLSARIRVLIWKTGFQMAKDHPIVGVGADNFGIVFNTARAELAGKHNEAGGEEIAEDLVLERAHNELLQIFAELGFVGLLLFAGAFISFAVSVLDLFRRNKFKFPPVLWAAIAGMIAFFGSSMVSSFSFRAIQNGLAFILIFAVAINETRKLRRPGQLASGSGSLRAPLLITGVAAVIMLVYCGTKAAGEYYLYQAQRTEQFDIAEPYCRASLRSDPGNAGAYYYLASRYAAEGDHRNASTLLREGIDRGLGVSVTYSLLAKYQTLAGDPVAAERTLSEAIRIFPRSVFLRVRYATFLESLGKPGESENQMDVARGIDVTQANGWSEIIRRGSVAAFYKAQGDPHTSPPAKLIPENAVLDYLDEIKSPTAASE